MRKSHLILHSGAAGFIPGKRHLARMELEWAREAIQLGLPMVVIDFFDRARLSMAAPLLSGRQSFVSIAAESSHL
jgi:hypothetical protein